MYEILEIRTTPAYILDSVQAAGLFLELFSPIAMIYFLFLMHFQVFQDHPNPELNSNLC